MSVSIIDHINQEYRTNIKRHQEQAQPLVDFFKRSIDVKYKQEEQQKVRGQQEADYGQQYFTRTGKPLEFTEGVSPQATYESKLGEFERGQAEPERISELENKAQSLYGKFYTEAKATAPEDEDPDITVNKAKVNWEAEQARIQAGITKEEEKKPTKFRDKLIDVGAWDDIPKYIESQNIKTDDVSEETLMNIYSNIKSIPDSYMEVGGKRVKRSGVEKFKQYMKDYDKIENKISAITKSLKAEDRIPELNDYEKLKSFVVSQDVKGKATHILRTKKWDKYYEIYKLYEKQDFIDKIFDKLKTEKPEGTVEQRKSGETIEQYLKRIGK